MGLGYVGAGGVAGLNKSLEDMIAERYKQQQDRQRQEQIAAQNEMQRHQIAQADRRIGLDESAAQERAEMQRASLQSLQSSRDETSADKLAADLMPGSTLDPASVTTLQKGNRGGLVEHTDADLPSRAMSGMATATDAAPSASPMRVIQSGRLARDTFKGTDAQRVAEQQRKDTLAQRAQLDADRDAARKSPALREFEDAKAQGFTGSFTDYQNADANRKRPNISVSTGQNQNLAMKLADDYTRDAKDFTAQNAAMRRVQASAQDPSPAGDMSLLYGYMKMLDPNSVVRESEFATAAQSGSLPQQIQGAATKLLNGQRLTPEQRADFVNRSQRLYAEAQGTNKTIRKSYTDRAKKFGVDPSLVFTEIEEPAAAAGAPKVVRYDMDGNPIK